MSNMPEKWVVIGSANGSSNLGDECMWEALVARLRRHRPEDVIFTDGHIGWHPPDKATVALPFLYPHLQRSPALLRGNERLSAIAKLTNRPRQLHYAASKAKRICHDPDPIAHVWQEAISGARGVIFSGAGAITDAYAVHGIHSWYAICLLARQFSVPVAFFGQGVGPIKRAINRSIAAKMIVAADEFTVREQLSADFVEAIAGRRPVVDGDWGLALRPRPEDRAAATELARRLTGGQRFVSWFLHRHHWSERRTIGRFADTLSEFLDLLPETHQILLMSNMTAGRYSDDRATQTQVREMLPNHQKGRVSVVDEVLSAAKTQALVGLSEGVVSSRYHPMIFALNEGVAATALAWNDYYVQKMEGVSTVFHVTDNVTDLRGASSGRTVYDRLVSCRPAQCPELVDGMNSSLDRFVESCLQETR